MYVSVLITFLSVVTKDLTKEAEGREGGGRGREEWKGKERKGMVTSWQDPTQLSFQLLKENKGKVRPGCGA